MLNRRNFIQTISLIKLQDIFFWLKKQTSFFFTSIRMLFLTRFFSRAGGSGTNRQPIVLRKVNVLTFWQGLIHGITFEGT